MRTITRGQRNIAWIEAHCRIPEGVDVGKNVRLRPWQKRDIRLIYDNPAITRLAILSFARKNAKTTMAAFLLLLHLVGPEARVNSQLFSAAQSRDQAAVTFALAQKIVMMSPTLRPYVAIREGAKQLFCPDLGTLYRALSKEATTAFGLSPIFVIHDELGQVKGPRSPLFNALETAVGAQAEPLSIVISTQAPTDADLLSVLIDDALAGHDPQTVISLYTAPVDDPPFTVKTLRKANPALGDFLNKKEVMSQARKAKRMPSLEASFRNLVLNQRVNQVSPFIPPAIWKLNAGAVDAGVLERNIVRVGLDLSARHDLTALVAVATENGITHARCWFFTPLEGLAERSIRDRVPYDLWHRQGHLIATPGATVAYSDVAEVLIKICDEYEVEVVNFDRWRIDVLKTELKAKGAELPLAPFGQGYKDMAPAIDNLESKLLNATLRHGGQPVLTMCAANSIIDSDPAGNRKLTKVKSTGRIDGLVALVMADAPTVVEALIPVAGELVAM